MQKISAVLNIVIITFIVLVAVKNSATTSVDLIFMEQGMPLFVLLIVTFLMGMIFGRTLFSMFTKKKK